MCRGNSGQRVFAEEKDYKGFLKRLGTVAGAFRVEIHAYALMTNHLHLFVRTRAANLSRFMQRVLSGYTQWFNARHGTYGHLFQGRYKALLVDKSGYGTAVSRYIHLNPAPIAGTGTLTVAQRQAILRNYRWSSYRAMIGLAKPEEWQETDATLSQWGSDVRAQQRAYATFVEQGLIEAAKDPTKEAMAQSILGKDRFVDRVRRLLLKRQKGDRESERSRRQVTADNVVTVLQRVAQAYAVTPEELKLVRMGQRGNEARQVAMWLARERCGAVATVREIGKALGGVSGSAVIVAHRRLSEMMKRSKRLQRQLQRLVGP